MESYSPVKGEPNLCFSQSSFDPLSFNPYQHCDDSQIKEDTVFPPPYNMSQNFSSLTVGTMSTAASSSQYSPSPLPSLSSPPPASPNHALTPASYHRDLNGTSADLFLTTHSNNGSSAQDALGDRSSNLLSPRSPLSAGYHTHPPDSRTHVKSDSETSLHSPFQHPQLHIDTSRLGNPSLFQMGDGRIFSPNQPQADDPGSSEDSPGEMEVDDKQSLAKTGSPSGNSKGGPTKPSPSTNFVFKLHQMVNDPKKSHFIKWTKNGQSFVVTNVTEFSRSILGSNFKHSNFSSFVRQLNMYGFHKINRNPRAPRSTSTDNQVWEFSHPKFSRDRPDLIEEIRRKGLDSSAAGATPNTDASPSTAQLAGTDFASSAVLATIEDKMRRLEHQNLEIARHLTQEMDKSRRLQQRCNELTGEFVEQRERSVILNRMVSWMWKFLEQEPRFRETLPTQNEPSTDPFSANPSLDVFLKDLADGGSGLGLNTGINDNNPPIRIFPPESAAGPAFPTSHSPGGQIFTPMTPSPQSSPASSTYPLGGHNRHRSGPILSLNDAQLPLDFQTNQRHSHSLSLPNNQPSPIGSLSSPLLASPGQSRFTHGHSQSLQLGQDTRNVNQRARMDDGSSPNNLGVHGGLSPTSPFGQTLARSPASNTHGLGGMNLTVQTNTWGVTSSSMHESDIDGRPLSAVSPNEGYRDMAFEGN